MNASEMVARAESLSMDYSHGTFNRTSERRGASRTVIVEGGYAFKAVQNERYAGNNRVEWDFYHMTTDAIRAKLAKPLYISRNGNVIVMEALTPWRERNLDFERLGRYEREIDNLTRAEHGIDSIGDLHGGNWGIRDDGSVVVLDYGAMEWLAQVHEWEKIQPDRVRWATPKPEYRKEMLADLLSN